MSGITVSPAVRRWRIILLGVGLVLLSVAGYTLLTEISPTRYVGIILWLGGAIVLHDGVGAMAVFGVSVLLRRAGRWVPFGVILVVQAALAVGAMVTVLVLPAIVKKAIGTANPSILPLDYLTALLIFNAVLAGAAAVLVIAVMTARMRRAGARTP